MIQYCKPVTVHSATKRTHKSLEQVIHMFHCSCIVTISYSKQFRGWRLTFLHKEHHIKTHVRLKSPYPVRNPDWAFFWAGLGTGLSLEHRSNCGRMPFLTPPMALMGFEPTTQRAPYALLVTMRLRWCQLFRNGIDTLRWLFASYINLLQWYNSLDVTLLQWCFSEGITRMILCCNIVTWREYLYVT